MKTCAAMLFCACLCLNAAQYYVSTTGTAGASGTIDDPLSIAKATGGTSPASPGDTIWLRGGTYSVGNSFSMTVAGTSGNPVTIKQYPGERAVLDGSVSANGAYVNLIGFEIWNSAAVNRTNSTDNLGPGLNLNSVGGKAINLVIHDTGAPGIWWPTAAGSSGTTIYGCILWGIGLYQTNGGYTGTARGPIIYAQSTNGTRVIQNNIAFKSWTEGIKSYAESLPLAGFCYSNNVSFLNYMDGFLTDTTTYGITNFIVTGNHSYFNAYDRFGDQEIQRDNCVISNNVFTGQSLLGYHIAMRVHGWTNASMTDNLFVETTANRTYADTMVFWQAFPTNAVQSWVIDRNKYYNGTDVYGNWATNNSARLQWAAVQANGFEASGENHNNVLPPSNTTAILTNAFEAGRAYIVVWNWEGLTSQTVSLANVGLGNGANYMVRDVQNWLGQPALTATFSTTSPNVTLPLNLTTVTPLVGTQTHFQTDPNVHTPTVFNVFAVLPSAPPGSARVKNARAGGIKGK